LASLTTDLATLVARARALAGRGGRTMLGITGEPGAGKSTLATALVAALQDVAVLVPMDGFHLSNAVLECLGRRSRKGAADTFDAAGYVTLLERLRSRSDDIVYAPAFDRDLEEAIAGSIPVPRDVPLVITEGNYLLLDSGDWGQVRPFLDEAWFLVTADEVRRGRLIRRHAAHGKAPEEAREWTLGSDEHNARLVSGTRPRADLVVRLPPDE
jgi:pantothenate kinase